MKEKNRKIKETKLVERNLVTFLFSLSLILCRFFFLLLFLPFCFYSLPFSLNLSLNVVLYVERWKAIRTRVERRARLFLLLLLL